MLTLIKKYPFRTAVVLFLLAVAALVAVSVAREDYTVEWNRRVPSKETPQTLGAALDDLAVWPVFHHTLKQANTFDSSGNALPTEASKLEVGSQLRYFVEPPQKQWKRFELVGKITDYQPGKRLALDFVSDSTGKTEKLFDGLEWSVEITEAPPELRAKGFASVIVGHASGRTKSWRGRFFGILSPRIMMNQVYPVDLVKLGTFQRQAEAKKNNLAPNYQ